MSVSNDTAVDGLDAEDRPEGGAPGRGHRRVTLELGATLGLLAGAWATRWIDGPAPSVLPAVQAVGASAVPTLGIGLLAAASRRWRLVVAACALALVQASTLVPWWVAGSHAVAGTNDELVVMSANVHYGNADADAITAAVRDRGIDVLVLHEATAGLRDELRAAGIADALPYVVDRSVDGCVPVYRADIEPIPGCISAAGGMIYSRHPVMSSDVPPVPDTTFEAPVATIDAPGGPVVVLAAHPVPPWPVDSRRWHAETTALATWAADTADGPPLVIAGDMNASEAHPALRRFGDAGMYDAQREVGAGPVRTWPRIAPFPFPWFHIDHVLVRGLGVADAGTVVLPGSDHDAVWAALAPAAGDVLGAQANRTATASSHN